LHLKQPCTYEGGMRVDVALPRVLSAWMGQHPCALVTKGWGAKAFFFLAPGSGYHTESLPT
jgi:hypothetical protein